MSQQRDALLRIPAEVDASKPDRRRLAEYVRYCIAETPEINSLIGWHMRRDLINALEGLLVTWGG